MSQVGVSILSSNYMSFGKEIEQIEQSNSDFLHIDIMDGYFVQNITFGSEMVRQINVETDLFLDIHLMVESPEKHIENFVKAGADLITFHYESCKKNVAELIGLIKSFGVRVGIAINPGTSVEYIKPFIYSIDLVLQMTVNPGFGGQKFNEETLLDILHTL